MTTVTTPPTTSKQRARVRGTAAVMLLTAGVLVLAGRVVPMLGDALALVLGLELLVLARLNRDDGPLIAGGLLTGAGTAVVLASGPLQGVAAHTMGGTFVLAVAGGLALIAALAAWWLHEAYHWAWITALGLGVLGGGLLAGPDAVADWLSLALPVGLLAGGAVLAVAWWRRSGE
ncbi:MAG TPA: hypothetical protein VI110_07930 [Lapillicoccus sp.]